MYGIIVYTVLYVLTITFASQFVYLDGKRKRKQYTKLLLLLLTFSLIVGLRYDVGADWTAYLDFLKGDVQYWSYDRLEPINRWTIFFVQNYKLHYCVWFIFMACIQILFVVLALKRSFVALLPIGILCYLSYNLSFDMNVIRQGCALDVALFAYTYIHDKQWKQFVFWIVVAFLFHKTAIVFLPLFFLGRIDRIMPVRIQIPLFLILIVGGSYVVQWLIGLTGSYWDLLSYGQKIDQLAEHEWEVQSGMGLGVLFTNIRRFAIICFSPKLFERYKDKGFAIFYNIFLIGACMYSATMSDMLLERMCRYLSICDIVVSAYFFHFLLKENSENSIMAKVFIAGILFITAYEVSSQKWQFISF